MTTIACDGRTIAADSRSTFGTLPAERPSQKLLVRDGRVFAVCGLDGLLERLADWHDAGADPTKMPIVGPEQGWEMHVVTRRGAYRFSNTAPVAVKVDWVWTMGSGRDYALGAMDAGAAPRRAVEIAKRRDIYTGGRVQVIDLAKVFAKPRRGARRSKRGRQT